MKEAWKRAATVLALAEIALSATVCSDDKAIITYKGGKITESQYCNKMKESQAGQSTFASMTVSDTLESRYSKDVTQKQVNKKYNKYKKQCGSQLGSVLEQNGMTASTFRDNLKANLLTEAVLKHIRRITPAQKKKAWKNYQPEVTVQHILVSKGGAAEDIIKQLRDGSDFKKLAKECSTDTATRNDVGKLPTFGSTDSTLDFSFKTATFKLKTDEITTTPVKTQYGYHVVKMIKRPTKGTLKKYKKQIDNQIYQSMSED